VERAYREASDAQRQAYLALDDCCEAWKAWEAGAAMPAERVDFEADEYSLKFIQSDVRSALGAELGKLVGRVAGSRSRKCCSLDIPFALVPLRSQSPDMTEQELWGYLLPHYAVSALVCTAATAAGIDPDRVKFKRTIRAVRRRVADPAFPPARRQRTLNRIAADISG
jgi:hypothetical protein